MEIAVILGFLLFIIDVWVVLRIARSESTEISKAMWIAIILILPIFAHIAWYLSGPGRPD